MRSILSRTVFVLGRAAAVAAPAGLVIWLLANTQAGGESLIARCAAFLDPLGRAIGLDGEILFSFVLGTPANEIVAPILAMSYLAQGSLRELALPELHGLLLANGWNGVTAVCMVVFTLLHWPCATTLLTVYRETKSLKWTALAFFLPTACGMGICFVIAAAARLFGL